MVIEWWICPTAPTLQEFDVLCGPEHCDIETRMDGFCRQIFFFWRIKKVFWQCSDIIVRIQVFIENDQIANTVLANDPHTIKRTIRFQLTMRRY